MIPTLTKQVSILCSYFQSQHRLYSWWQYEILIWNKFRLSSVLNTAILANTLKDFSNWKLKNNKGVSPGLVVMWGNSSSEGRGFESQHGMDIFSHLFVVKIVMFVWKNEQEAGMTQWKYL